MALVLYNTRTNRTEPFVPRVAGEVSLYVCGLTTYDHAHAGHARTNTTFDVLVRHLRAKNFKVQFIRNITDVDDKIIKRAAECGEEPISFSKRMSELNARELSDIGCMTPDHEPRVSTHIPEIVALVEKLVERGCAYVAPTNKGNDVYFAVRKFSNYCKLSKRNIGEMRAGARVVVDDIKKDPLDFALWKASLPEELGWDSPWGRGRPGWHIECSAMAARYLGEHFDIHGGGMDLIFPHHENEIAQSESVFGPELANVWMHGGFLEADGEKMSKSLGNFVTIKQVLDRNDPEGFRYFLLGSHYRGPLGFDLLDVGAGDEKRVVFPGVDDAEKRVEYLYMTLSELNRVTEGVNGECSPSMKKAAPDLAKVIEGAVARASDALDQDLNTSVALSVLGELAKASNDLLGKIAKAFKKDPSLQADALKLARLASVNLNKIGATLGLLESSPEQFFARCNSRRLRVRGLSADWIESKIAERKSARETKDFARGDAVRDELAARGVEVLDSPTGTTWRVSVG